MIAALRAKSLRTIVCDEYQRKFKDLFADEVRVTPAICVAVFDQFPWPGTACRLLSTALYARFDRRHSAIWRDHHNNGVYAEAQRAAEIAALRKQDARLFAVLFNDKANAGKRAALRRLARK